MANIKIFKMDDCSWYAAHNLMEFLNWYNKHIDSIEVPNDLSEFKEAGGYEKVLCDRFLVAPPLFFGENSPRENQDAGE